MSREKLEVGDRVFTLSSEDGSYHSDYVYGTVVYLSAKGTMARVDWDPGFHAGQRTRADRLEFMDTFEPGDIVTVFNSEIPRVGIVESVYNPWYEVTVSLEMGTNVNMYFTRTFRQRQVQKIG